MILGLGADVVDEVGRPDRYGPENGVHDWGGVRVRGAPDEVGDCYHGDEGGDDDHGGVVPPAFWCRPAQCGGVGGGHTPEYVSD